MSKAVVLLSGGIDSAVALADTINKFGKENVEAMVFDYGQRNSNELIYSKKISDYYNIKNTCVDISNLFCYSNSSLLKHSTKEISHLEYDKQVEINNSKNVDTNVPFRNGLFLSIASSYAISREIDYIVYGIHYENGIAHDLYPDCSEEFNDTIANAIYVGSGKMVSVLAPLVQYTKKDIIKLGIEYKVPFDLTWTCYDNKEFACGKCNSCKDRLKAFEENNFIDPIKYE